MPLRNYRERFTLPSGKLVFVPTGETRQFGTTLKRQILRRWTPPPHFYHLRSGGHVAAAKRHLSNGLFAKLDLERCFDHVTRSKVNCALRSIRYLHPQAYDIACVSTVEKTRGRRDFSIPFGFVQSPVLASLAIDMSFLGSTLKSIAHRSGLRISVYVDDIIISSDREDGQLLQSTFDEVRIAAERSSFAINEAKSVTPSMTLEIFNLTLSRGSLRVLDDRMLRFEDCVLHGSIPAAHAVIGYVGTINHGQGSELKARMAHRPAAD